MVQRKERKKVENLHRNQHSHHPLIFFRSLFFFCERKIPFTQFVTIFTIYSRLWLLLGGKHFFFAIYIRICVGTAVSGQLFKISCVFLFLFFLQQLLDVPVSLARFSPGKIRSRSDFGNSKMRQNWRNQRENPEANLCRQFINYGFEQSLWWFGSYFVCFSFVYTGNFAAASGGVLQFWVWALLF